MPRARFGVYIEAGTASETPSTSPPRIISRKLIQFRFMFSADISVFTPFRVEREEQAFVHS